MRVCKRETGRERGRRGRYKTPPFAISLAVADAVYTRHREVRGEASPVTAKTQHGRVFSLAYILWLGRSWFAVAARIMRLYAFPARVHHAGRCKTDHAHRRPLAEQTDLTCIYTLVSCFVLGFFLCFSSLDCSVGQRDSSTLRRALNAVMVGDGGKKKKSRFSICWWIQKHAQNQRAAQGFSIFVCD